MANYVKGIDISKYQPGMDWERVRAQNIRFVFIKATQGESHVDPFYLSHWAGAKQAGLLRGAYHYLDPNMDGRRQAENFLRAVHLESGDLPPALDIEMLPAAALQPATGKKGVKGGGTKAGGGTKGTKGAVTSQINNQIISCAEVWLRIVAEATNRKPFVYSAADFLNTRMSINGKPPSWASKYPVWIANYLNIPVTDNSRPFEASGWPGFTFWQYSKSGNVDGVYDDVERTKPTVVDQDFFKGTLEELYAFAGASLPADTPSATA